MNSPQLELPAQIPVMVLPNCNLLPHGLLPLYIFEPRYRQMLADALESNRMFAIGCADPESAMTSPEPEVSEYSCAGMVRACVGGDDGTSHLILQGVQRIRFCGWPTTSTPYRVAEIEPVPSFNENAESSKALANRAIDLAREQINTGLSAHGPQALEEMEAINDPEPLADLIAYHLIRDPQRRQALLEIQEIGERLRFVIAELSEVGPSLP